MTDALKAADPGSWTGKFLEIVCNDERQFNAPGLRIPMLSLSRCLPRDADSWPYPEYHTDLDTPEAVDPVRLSESRDAVMHMIEALERVTVPRSLWRGELFYSRYALQLPASVDARSKHRLLDVLHNIDGTHTTDEICEMCDVSPGLLGELLSELRRHGLVTDA